MRFSIPAKTFLVGEYLALSGLPALVITTTPHFELSLGTSAALLQHAIHPKSPAGQFLLSQMPHDRALLCDDPYQGKGGFGASSAQFVGAYLLYCTHVKMNPTLPGLFEAYQAVHQGQSIKPSGYDVLAQAIGGCVYIDKQNEKIDSLRWDFEDLSFGLFHTGKKLATHQHLSEISPIFENKILQRLVNKAHHAFLFKDSEALIEAVNGYHDALLEMGLVASHTTDFIHLCRQYPEVLAAKGCGALGADVILVLTRKTQMNALKSKMTGLGLEAIATTEQIAPISSFFS